MTRCPCENSEIPQLRCVCMCSHQRPRFAEVRFSHVKHVVPAARSLSKHPVKSTSHHLFQFGHRITLTPQTSIKPQVFSQLNGLPCSEEGDVPEAGLAPEPLVNFLWTDDFSSCASYKMLTLLFWSSIACVIWEQLHSSCLGSSLLSLIQEYSRPWGSHLRFQDIPDFVIATDTVSNCSTTFQRCSNGRPFCFWQPLNRCGLRRSQSSSGRADRQQSRGALAGDETQRCQQLPAPAAASWRHPCCFAHVCPTVSCCGKWKMMLAIYYNLLVSVCIGCHISFSVCCYVTGYTALHTHFLMFSTDLPGSEGASTKPGQRVGCLEIGRFIGLCD